LIDNSLGDDNSNWDGDDDLHHALGITESSQATILEFDFVPLANSLSFNYIFASNEYLAYFPCIYSDGFAFLIKKAGSDEEYKNLAILPNTNLPVLATSVHPKINDVRINNVTYSGCEANNEMYFNGYNNITSPINYAGQTVVMNAKADVVPGETYHLKLVIADDKTGVYNSAVFIESGSFVSKVDFGEKRTFATNNPACFGESILLDTKLDASYLYKWFKDGNLISGASSNTYSATSTGVYTVEVNVAGNTCLLTGEMKVEFADDILSSNTSLVQCDDDADGFTAYNLTKVDDIIKNNVSDVINSGYYESLADATSKTNAISIPENYTNKTANQIVYARIESKYGCFKVVEVTLQISNNTISNIQPVAVCDADDNQDGLYQFDLNLEVSPKITLGLPNGLAVNYYLNADDALSETNVLTNTFKNTIPFTQVIYARFVNGMDCYGIMPITLIINTFDPLDFEDQTEILCENSQINLAVSSGFDSYLWNTGDTNNSISVNSAGDYLVTVKDANGCEKTKTFKVILSEPATITGVVVKDFLGSENTVSIEYTGVGNYEFSLDGNIFQNESVFTSVKPGIYNALSRDKNNCGVSNSFLFYVLDYPRFFTPNGDGYNDVWMIKNLNLFASFELSIFDRYGKLLKQINQNNSVWNGLYNAQILPADDYWFTLIYDEGRKINGNFSLKR
jgi:gliding motility-associated-like protein